MLIWFGLSASPGLAVEVHSNGAGGGLWSDPGTWRNKTIPEPEDDAVIARGDTVVFDRNDDGKASCHQLFIDPKGLFTYKTGAGKLVFCPTGVIEVYGTFKLESTKSAKDIFELRFLNEMVEERVLRVFKGGALLIAGRAHLPDKRNNVSVTSRPANADKLDPTAEIDAVEGCLLDVKHAALVHINLKATSIDNTGAKPNERVNITDCRFSGNARLYVAYCDTALIANNTFERPDSPQLLPALLVPAAIYVIGCPLVDVRGNTVRGKYTHGITGWGQTDSSVTKNTLEQCSLYWYGANLMVKDLTIKDVDTAVIFTSSSGAFEDLTVENCKLGIHWGAVGQMTGYRCLKPPKDGVPLLFVSGTLRLVNCDLQPQQLQFTPGFKAPPAVGDKPRPDPVESMQYVVVEAKGKFPPGAAIAMHTAGAQIAPGALDLNVRNSPARLLPNGLTPLPQTLEPLTVRTWAYDPDMKLIPPAPYMLSVLGPPSNAEGDRKTLKTLLVTPDATWHREKPNVKTPTLEVSLP